MTATEDNNKYNRSNDKYYMMSSSLSPTARHSNRKHHSASTTTTQDDDDDDNHRHNCMVEEDGDATATPTPSPSPPQHQKQQVVVSSSTWDRRGNHPPAEYPLSPPFTSPKNNSPSKYGRTFVSTTTTPLIKSPFVANNTMPVVRGMEWKRLQPCTVARQDMASTVVLQNTSSSFSGSTPLGILLVGGRSEELDRAAMDTVELLDWSSKRWRMLPSLNQARCGCAVASIDDTFYVFGGVGSSNIEDTSWVETLTMGGKAWIPIVTSPMPQGSRWHPAAVALPFQEEIVVLGGRDPTTWKELSTVYSFDTDSHQWTNLSSMSRPRFACGATQLTDSTLLVCGGYDGTEWTATCEVYDFTTNRWSSDEDDVASMPLPGLQFVTATTITEELVLVTGQRDDALLSSASSSCGGTEMMGGGSDTGRDGGSVWMVYHTTTNEWITLPVFPPSIAEEMAGCTLAGVAGKYVVAVGGTDPDGLPTKNTRISTNLMMVIHMAMNGGLSSSSSSLLYSADEVTVQSYRSNSSASKRTDPTVGSRESHSHSHRRNDSGNSSLGCGNGGAATSSPPPPAFGRVSAIQPPWTFSPNNSASNVFQPQSSYHKRGSTDSDKAGAVVVTAGGTATTAINAPPVWAGPVSHIQLVDQSSSVMSGNSGDSTMEGQFLSWNGEDALSEDWSASTGMDAPTYQLISPTRSQKRRSSNKAKRQIVQDSPIVDSNGINVVYSGHLLQGRPSGRGRMTWENGDCYIGAFKHGQRHGKGCQSYSDGRQYEGRFVGNFTHDPNGSMTWKDGTLYVGAFVQGNRTGNGIQRFPTGVRYEGEFVNGKYHGRGICCFADGSIYNGEWTHGRAHGSGILRDKRGAVLYSGLWQDDSPVSDDDDK